MERTKAVLGTYIRGIALRTKILLLFIQFFFIIFYGYLIYKNIDRIHFVIIYSCIALLGVIWFFYEVFHLDIRTNEEADNKAEIIESFRIFNWLLKALVIGITIYQYINGELTEFSLLMLIVSIIALVSQFVIDAYSRYTIKNYLLLFAAINVDYETANSAIRTVCEVTNINKIADEKLENREGIYDKLEEVNYEYHIISLLEKINKKKHKILIGNKELKRRKIRKYFERNLKKAESILLNINDNKDRIDKLIEDTCGRINKYPDEYKEIEDLIICSKNEIKLLLFFLKNIVVNTYGDLSEISNKLILSTILYINDDKNQLINSKKSDSLSDDIFFIHTTILLILDELATKNWRDSDSVLDSDKILINYNDVKIGIKDVIDIINKLKKTESGDGFGKTLAKNMIGDIKKSIGNKVKDIKNKLSNK